MQRKILNAWRAPTLLLLVASCSCSPAVEDIRTDKVAMLHYTDELYHELLAVADRCSKRGCESNGSFDEAKAARLIEPIVGGVDDPAVLMRLAVLSLMSYHPGEAGLQPVDAPFDAAWRLSVRRLASLRTRQALRALYSLDALLSLDGGDSLVLRDTIERVEREVGPPYDLP